MNIALMSANILAVARSFFSNIKAPVVYKSRKEKVVTASSLGNSPDEIKDEQTTKLDRKRFLIDSNEIERLKYLSRLK